MPSGLPGFLSEAEQQTLHALAEFTRATAPEVWATDALGLVEEEEWRTTSNPNPNPNPNPSRSPSPCPSRDPNPKP